MPRYNIHKRQTLDRVSFKHQLRMRRLLGVDMSKQVSDIFQSLNAGRDEYAPPTAGLSTNIKSNLRAHENNTILVGVSDGIQEISPEQELSMWEKFPTNMPIEDTLTVKLQTQRTEIVRKLATRVKDIKKGIFAQNVATLTNTHLVNIRNSYFALAQDWLIGKGTVEDVKAMLGLTLRKTDNEAAKIFRTETTSYFNLTRHGYFAGATDTDFMQLFVVTDGRISSICDSRANFIMTIIEAGLKKNMPSFHPHCRTIQRALISSLKRHAAIIAKFKNSVKESDFVPLPKGWV